MGNKHEKDHSYDYVHKKIHIEWQNFNNTIKFNIMLYIYINKYM